MHFSAFHLLCSKIFITIILCLPKIIITCRAVTFLITLYCNYVFLTCSNINLLYVIDRAQFCKRACEEMHVNANAFKRGDERDSHAHGEAKAVARKRVHTRRRTTQLHTNANAFTRGGERGRTRMHTRSHREANVVTCERKRVHTRRRTQTRSHKDRGERNRTQTQTRGRYTLHLSGTVQSLGLFQVLGKMDTHPLLFL